MKTLFGTLKSFCKNVGLHVGGVFSGRESGGEAIRQVKSDSRKILRMMRGGERSQKERDVTQLLKKGVERYNKKDYVAAERYFRKAWEEDPGCTLAVTYLGNTLYKNNMLQEAVMTWRRAYEIDPRSEGGAKALKKLQAMDRMKTNLVAKLEDRVE